MEAVIFLPALALAAWDWGAVHRGDRKAERFFKPAVIVALIVIAPIFGADAPGDQVALIMLALCASLAGDVFLLPPDNFILGLGSFLVAHLLYLTAFFVTSGEGFIELMANGWLFLFGPISLFMFLRVSRGAREKGKQDLVVPLAAYVAAITLMVLSAFGTLGAEGMPQGASLGAAIGATLFFISDGLIGWSRFVKEYPWSRVAIMITYHLGQFGLVYSLAR